MNYQKHLRTACAAFMLSTALYTNAQNTPTVIWQEDWSDYYSTEFPDERNPYYKTDKKGAIEFTNIAGGTIPELSLPSKSDKGYFQATIPLQGATGDLHLSFKTQNLKKTNVTIMCKYGKNWYKPKVSANGTEYTIYGITAADTHLQIRFDNTNTIRTRIDDIKLTASNKKNPQVSFAPHEPVILYEGTSSYTSPSLRSASPVAPVYSSSNNSVATVDNSGYVTIHDKGEATITATVAGNEDYFPGTAFYNLCVADPSNIYYLVTDANSLREGDVFIIVCRDARMTLGRRDFGYGCSAEKAVLYDDIVVPRGDTKRLMLAHSSTPGKWLLKDANENLYALKQADEYKLDIKNIDTPVADASISIENGDATITFVNQYNLNFFTRGQGIFNIYKTPYVPVQIYRNKNNVKSVNVSIGSTGYATLYYSTLSLLVPQGVTAYTYKAVGGALAVSRTYSSGAILPASTGVILRGNPDNYLFDVVPRQQVMTTDGDPDNILKGTDDNAETEGNKGDLFYKLSLDAHNTPGTIGFYWGAKSGAAFVNKAHKAYLALPSSKAANAKDAYPFADMAAIHSVVQQSLSTPTYDLQGRSIASPSKGIYIKNHKKIVVK